MLRSRASPPGNPECNVDGHGDPVALAASQPPVLSLEAQVESLNRMTIPQLRDNWVRCFGEAAPSHGRDLLRRQLAWKMQARVHGDLSSDTRQRIRRLHQAFHENPRFTPSPTFDLLPGTVLTRQWQGVLHRVQVMHEGFVYGGERFDSLSEVARRITGTRWSGPAFFRLKAPAEEKP
jgi:hypothetical protein